MMEDDIGYNFNEYKKINRTGKFPNEGELKKLTDKELEDDLALILYRMHKESGCRNIHLVSGWRERTQEMKKTLIDCDIYRKGEQQPDFEIHINVNTVTKKDFKI